ncbi:MAG: aminopeptidase P family protein [Parachlamydiaceae bacterium]|nr:aminopeptidase P family protein [Parachlamydiaceae bacterium]
MNFLDRLTKLQNILNYDGVDLLIVEDPTDLYYMTGLQLSAGKLLVDQQKATLFVDGRYREMCAKHSPYPVCPVDKASLISWLGMPENNYINFIGFDTSKTTYKKFLEWEEILLKSSDIESKTSKMSLKPIDSPISPLRLIKEKEEIECLKKAGLLGSLGFDLVCSHLKEGVTEQEIAAELEIFWKRQGGQGLAFESIIAFGTNSSMPHYRPKDVPLVKGDPVLIDIGVKLYNYHSDMTRTVFFGKPSEKMLTIYDVVLEAQLKSLEICRPGTLIKELDKAARDHIISKGFGEYFSHNLGHGVGLEIHESPTISQTAADADKALEEGMVITIEPGIYLPDIGGVRIEDTIVITASGYENITQRSKELVVI